jgi:hypothetical protein
MTTLEQECKEFIVAEAYRSGTMQSMSAIDLATFVQKKMAKAEQRGYLRGVEAVKVKKIRKHPDLDMDEVPGWNSCVDALELVKKKLLKKNRRIR